MLTACAWRLAGTGNGVRAGVQAVQIVVDRASKARRLKSRLSANHNPQIPQVPFLANKVSPSAASLLGVSRSTVIWVPFARSPFAQNNANEQRCPETQLHQSRTLPLSSSSRRRPPTLVRTQNEQCLQCHSALCRASPELATLGSLRRSKTRRKKQSPAVPRFVVSTPPLKPPPRVVDPLHTFPTRRAHSTPRSSYRSVKALFEDIERADRPQLTTSRFAKSKAATPPAKRPDPTKCNPRDRQVVRKLFEELQQLPNRPQTTQRPVSSHFASFVPEKPRRTTFTGRRGDVMPKGHQFHHNDQEDSSEPEQASEIVSEMEQVSEVDQQYQEVFRYEPGSGTGPTEDHIIRVQHIEHGHDHGHGNDHHEHGHDHEDQHGHEHGYEEVHDHEYEEQQTEVPDHFEEEYQEEVYEEHQEEVYEEHVEVNRDSVASSANSFDQVAKEMAQDLQVLDQVDDQELRNLAELIPERNQDRLFSGDEPARNASHPRVHDLGTASNGDRVIKGTNYISQSQEDGDAESEDSEMPELPRAPPSLVFRTERLSKNVADAMATIWDRFWSEDVKQITLIIKNRFSEILPYFRRFLAHLVAFWGGITYIRRALTAFIRILNRDERVRELLERVGWASATTVRVFLSICAMVMQATLQMYYLVRNRIIPDTRRVIPILYYKAILKLLKAAERSPWSLVLGPFSLTFAIDSSKLPDRYYLHNKLSVPEEDVTFASGGGMQTLVQSMRESLHRTRYGYGSQASTPVHSQTTDEMPFPPPTEYTVSRVGEEDTRHHHHHHNHHGTKHGKENVSRYAPLSERTNHDSHFHPQG